MGLHSWVARLLLISVLTSMCAANETDDDDFEMIEEEGPEGKANAQDVAENTDSRDGNAGFFESDAPIPPKPDWTVREKVRIPGVSDGVNMPRLMILVISGGTNPATVQNLQTVVETWADNHTYYVTRNKVPASVAVRQIILPPFAEEGGRRRLHVKVMSMWQYVATHFVDDYDFFIKCDDDTFLNIARLKADLAILDPEKFIFLGAKRFAATMKGLKPANPLLPAKHGMRFAHGGAGYILSRALVKKMDGRFLACLKQPPMLSLEDAKLAGCLYHHVGIDTIDMTRKLFGSLDVWRNGHNQDVLAGKLKQMSRTEVSLVGSFHSVQSSVQQSIYRVLQKIPMAEVQGELYARLDERRRLGDATISSIRACNISLQSDLSVTVDGVQPGYEGVCTETVFSSLAPVPALPVWALESPSRNEMNLLLAEMETFRASGRDSSGGVYVFVVIEKPEELLTLDALVASVRRYHPQAVFILIASLKIESTFVPENGGEFILQVPSKNMWHASLALIARVLSEIVAKTPASQTPVSLVLRLPSVLQYDIFSALARQDHVIVPTTENMAWSLKSKCHISQTHQLNIIPEASMWLSAGPARLHFRYLSAIVSSWAQSVAGKFMGCTPGAFVSEMVWYKRLSGWSGVALVASWGGLVSDLGVHGEGRWWRYEQTISHGPDNDGDQSVRRMTGSARVVQHHGTEPGILMNWSEDFEYDDDREELVLRGGALSKYSEAVSKEAPALPEWLLDDLRKEMERRRKVAAARKQAKLAQGKK